MWLPDTRRNIKYAMYNIDTYIFEWIWKTWPLGFRLRLFLIEGGSVMVSPGGCLSVGGLPPTRCPVVGPGREWVFCTLHLAVVLFTLFPISTVSHPVTTCSCTYFMSRDCLPCRDWSVLQLRIPCLQVMGHIFFKSSQMYIPVPSESSHKWTPSRNTQKKCPQWKLAMYRNV